MIKFYQQNKTSENVTTMAVYLLNDFMKHFEENLFDAFNLQLAYDPVLWLRFMNDNFMGPNL